MRVLKLVLEKLDSLLGTLRNELKINLESFEKDPENFIDQNVKEKKLLVELLEIENYKINHLAGNMELLKVLRRNNSNSKFAVKTSQLDISNILESSLTKSVLGETKSNKKRVFKGPVKLRKK
jgi:hypothetical protein